MQGRHKRQKLEQDDIGFVKDHAVMAATQLGATRSSLASQAVHFPPVLIDMPSMSSTPTAAPAPSDMAPDVLHDSPAVAMQYSGKHSDGTAGGTAKWPDWLAGDNFAASEVERWSKAEADLGSLQQLLEDALLAAGEGVGDNFDHVTLNTTMFSTTAAEVPRCLQHSKCLGNPVVAVADETTLQTSTRRPALKSHQEQCSGMIADAWLLDETLVDACFKSIQAQCWQLQQSLAKMQQLMDQAYHWS